jgi:hypothetical protein
LRDRFGIGKEDFRVILVGKDGGVKRRIMRQSKQKQFLMK